METNNTKSKGTNLKVANAPNRNGNGENWENFGNFFLESSGHRGTLYLDVTVQQLQALIATAVDGRVKKKNGAFGKTKSAKTAPAQRPVA